jgi:hypothetical protein
VTVRRIERCPSCRNRIDPDWCHCGSSEADHGSTTGHGFIPAGCTCGYEKPIRKAQRTEGYSESVTERLDAERPAYSSAVKSLAAFCEKNNMTKACFQVLVSHLDNACAESACAPRTRRLIKLS